MFFFPHFRKLKLFQIQLKNEQNALKPNKIEAIVTFLTNNIIVSIQQKNIT